MAVEFSDVKKEGVKQFRTVFTSSGSFVVPESCYAISASGCGAGGQGNASRGGASGVIGLGVQIPVTPGETLTVNVGTGDTTLFRSSTVLLRLDAGSGDKEDVLARPYRGGGTFMQFFGGYSQGSGDNQTTNGQAGEDSPFAKGGANGGASDDYGGGAGGYQGAGGQGGGFDGVGFGSGGGAYASGSTLGAPGILELIYWAVREAA